MQIRPRRRLPQKEPKEPEPEEETEDEFSSSEPEDSSSEESEQEFSPKARRPTRKPQSQSQQSPAPVPSNQSQNSIYEMVQDPTIQASMESTVVDWLDQYREDHAEALQKLMNFLLQSTGCPEGISRDDVEQGHEHATDVLTELHQRYMESIHMDYPIVSNKKQFKKFRKNFMDFWTRWLRNVQLDFLFTNDEEDGDHQYIISQEHGELSFEFIKSFVASMSISPFRPFRHTATLTVLTWLTALAGMGRQMSDQLVSVDRQLAGCQKHTLKHKELVQTQLQLQQRIQIIHEQIQDFVGTLFVHRYRDVDPAIRRDCMHALGLWLDKYPHVFLHTNYLKYVGWVLSDKDATVRLAAVQTAHKAIVHPLHNSAVRSFSERFKARLVEMAAMDVDEHVQREILQTVLLPLIRQEIVEEEDMRALYPLLTSTLHTTKHAVPIRYEAALVLVYSFVEVTLQSELEGVTEEERDPIVYRCFCRWMKEVVMVCMESQMEFENRLARKEAGASEDVSYCMTECEKLTAVRRLSALAVDSVLHALKSSSIPKDHAFVTDTLTDVDLWMHFLLDDTQEWTGMQEILHLVMFVHAVRSHVEMAFDPEEVTGSCFEEYHFKKSAARGTQDVPKKVSKLQKAGDSDVCDAGTALIQKLIGKIEPLMRRYGIPGSDSDIAEDYRDCWFSMKHLSLLELIFWALIGFAVRDSQRTLHVVDASLIWTDLRQNPLFESCLKYLVDDIFMKQNHPTVIKAVGRILFGSWKVPTSTDPYTLSLSSCSSTLQHVARKSIDATSKSLLQWLDKTSHALSGSSCELSDDELVTFVNNLRRIEVMLRNGGLVEGTATNYETVFEHLCSFLSSLVSSENAVFGLDFKVFTAFRENPTGIDVDAWLCDLQSDLTDAIPDQESSQMLLLSAQIIHSTFVSMFQLLIWCRSKIGSDDSNNWFRLAESFFALSSDILLIGNAHVRGLFEKSREDVLNRLQDSNADSLDQTDELDQQSLVASQKLVEDRFFEDFVLSVSITGLHNGFAMDSLICMVGDLLSLVPKQRANTSPVVELSQSCISSFLDFTLDNVFPNILANSGAKNILVAAPGKSAAKPDVPTRQIAPYEMQELLAEIFSLEMQELNVIAYQKIYMPPLIRKTMWPLLQKWMTTYVRGAWLSLNWRGISNQLTINQLGSVFSWNGKWNPWVDELSKCVIEEWRNFVLAHSAATDLKLSSRNTFLRAFKKSLGATLLTYVNSDDENAEIHYEPVLHLTHCLVTVFRARVSGKVPSKPISELFSLLLVSTLQDACVNKLKTELRQSVDLPSRVLSCTVSEFVHSIMKSANSLLGTVGAFGHDLLTGADAHALFDQLKLLVEDALKNDLRDLSENDSTQWEVEFQKLLRGLVGIAKRGGAPVSDFFVAPLPRSSKSRPVSQVSSPTTENKINRLDSLAELSSHQNHSSPKNAKRSTRVLSETNGEENENDGIYSTQQLEFQSSPPVKRVRRQYF